jgi:hypothetical protein
MILNSLLFGSPGTYKTPGIEMRFNDRSNGRGAFGTNWFGRTVDYVLTTPIVPVITLGYLHVVIHELGHAFASWLQGTNEPHTIYVYTKTCRGEIIDSDHGKITALAGPLAGITWELLKLIGSVAIATFAPPAIGLPLGAVLGAGSAFWLFGELIYACSGAGDWSIIRGH